MAKRYSNDLRRKVLEAYIKQEGTIAEIATRFRVSVGYVKKILRQYRRTGTMEWIPHRPGRKPKFTPLIREQIRAWLKTQSDLTLAEIQGKLQHGEQIKVSLPSLWVVLKNMGLRLKKSRSTPKNRTRRASNSNAKRTSRR